MIKYIQVKNSYKANWLDDRGVLVGFDNFQQCCEEFGYKVYEKESGKLVFNDPDGIPYHFAKTYETNTDETNTNEKNSKIKRAYCGDPLIDLFQVEMFPDDRKGPVLVFECFNNHNGYYYHDFDMKVDFKED
nr:MAG TPA: hypothetical protein [Caudoviricetes sp.]